jgi:hypothetical protein
MRQYHVIPKAGTPAAGPLSASQVITMFEQADSTAQMLIWWKDRTGWDKIADHIDEVRLEARDAWPTSSPKATPVVVAVSAPVAKDNGIPAGHVRVTRDNVSIGEFHEPDVPALLRAKVLHPTDLYLSAGMNKPAPLSELLLALLLKPSSAHQAGPTANAIVGGVAPSLPQTQRPSPAAGGTRTARGKCCPRCDSEDIRTFEMVYKSGSSSANTIGITMSGDVGQAHTRSTTDLASEVAPPDMSGPGCFSIVISAGLGMIFGAIIHPIAGPLIGAIIGLVARVGIHFAGASDRDAQYERWKKSWMCMKCGNKFLS